MDADISTRLAALIDARHELGIDLESSVGIAPAFLRQVIARQAALPPERAAALAEALGLSGHDREGFVEQVHHDGLVFTLRRSALDVDLDPRQVQESLRRPSGSTGSMLSPAQIRRVLEAARVCVWNWDARSGAVTRSPGFERIIGLDRPLGSTTEAYWACVHPQDRQSLGEQLGRALRQGTCFAHSYRLIDGDGGIRPIADRAQPVTDAAGALTGLSGVLVALDC